MRNSGTAKASSIPRGLALHHLLRGHTESVNSLTWTPNGNYLLSGSADGTIRVWELATGRLLQTIEGHSGRIHSIAITPDGGKVLSGMAEYTIKVWELATGQLLQTLRGHSDAVFSIAVTLDGQKVLSGSADGTIRLWELATSRLLQTLGGRSGKIISTALTPDGKIALSVSEDRKVGLWELETGNLFQTLEGHSASVGSVVVTSDGKKVLSGAFDKTIRLWELATGRLLHTLEGHFNLIYSIAINPNNEWLASKSLDGTVRIWEMNSGRLAATLEESHNIHQVGQPVITFHPTLPYLATVGGEARQDIRIWDLNYSVLRGKAKQSSSISYRNAKVVLLGDTGVGKSGLSLVLNNQPFEPTDSTPGRRVWTFDSCEVEIADNLQQTRETLLWDLAGQPGYRVIHQLHLNEVAVALVVFDARSEIDPLSGVRHWERALRLAQQRQGTSAVPLKKLLVSARNDRGTVSVSKERLLSLLNEYGFDGYFETSAKEGWKIKELREAIESAIPWEELPVVSSSALFAEIKEFLLDVKKTGRLLAPVIELYNEFIRLHPDIAESESNLSDQFSTCIGRLENRDLIRRLTFGGYVLLQPELLDAYASAMVNTAKEEPDGLGSLPEDVAYNGRFFVPDEQKVKDVAQEQLLLHATIEELVQRDLAIKENADDGRYLVFPSQFNRDYEDAPDPKGKAVAITFEGPVQSLYATLAVRLGHSGIFTTGRHEMWRNAALFKTRTGGKCGLYLHEFAEARGRLILFYEDASDETQFHFEEFVLAHAKRRALDGTVELVRFFICQQCDNPVPDAYVKILREKGQLTFPCPCGQTVSLAEPQERLQFPSKLDVMEKSADRQRDFESFVVSAKGETRTPDFLQWAGGERVTLAIVFTDVVGSTILENEIGGERMNEVRRAHFKQSRQLIAQYRGREIRTIGDSFMVAFHCVEDAFDYSRAFKTRPGHAEIKIRAGIHVGALQVEEGDVFGSTVSFAARVVEAIEGGEIWISERAKADLDQHRAQRHNNLKWEPREVGEDMMKGFSGTFTLWALKE